MTRADRNAVPTTPHVPPPSSGAWSFVRAMPSLEHEMLALRALVPTGGICLDVGASYGSYSVLLARLVGPSGTVHALEPRRRSRAVLRVVSRVLGAGNIVVHDLALAAIEGEAQLLTPRRRWGLPVPGRSFLLDTDAGDVERDHEYGGGADLARVRRTTLDRLGGELDLGRLDVVKIDVEGGELAVLAGGEDTLRRHRPLILCEIEQRHTQRYGHRAGDVFAWLGERGWDAHVYDRSGLDPVAGPVPGRNNYLFVSTR